MNGWTILRRTSHYAVGGQPRYTVFVPLPVGTLADALEHYECDYLPDDGPGVEVIFIAPQGDVYVYVVRRHMGRARLTSLAVQA